MSLFVSPLRQSTLTKTRAERDDQLDKPKVPDDPDRSPPASPADEDEEVDGEGREDDEDSPDEEENRDRINPGAGKHRSLRYQHIDVLVTIVHKSILDADWERAERSFSLLLRCKGVDIRLCYEQGLQILNRVDPSGRRSIDFLLRLIVAYPPLKPRRGMRSFDRADKYVVLLTELRIFHRQYTVAMQELDKWLLVPPFNSNKLLWRYLADVCRVLEDEARARDDKQEAAAMARKRIKAEAKARQDDSMGIDSD